MCPSDTPQPKPISTHSIVLSRHGAVTVNLRATVDDDELFIFTIPRKDFQRSLDSLQVSDSRGNIPSVTFKAPAYISTDGLSSYGTAWNDIVRDNEGALVHLKLRNGTDVQGHLHGFERSNSSDSDDSRNKYNPATHTLILMNDYSLSQYRVDTILCLGFMDCDITRNLSRFSYIKNRIMDTESRYRVLISAHGSGSGEITISYRQESPFDPAFDISYMCYPDKGVPDYGVHPCLLKCFATIRNPLHCDLQDVWFTLDSGIVRHNGDATVYVNEPCESETLSDWSRRSVPENGSDTEDKIEPEAEPDSEEERLRDSACSSNISSSSWTVFDSKPAMIHKLSEKISLTIGEAIRVLLFEKRCEAGRIHLFDKTWQWRGYCSMSYYINNNTDVALEPGRITFHPDSRMEGGIIDSYLPIGFCAFKDYSVSGCGAKKTKSSRIVEVHSCDVVGRNMILTYICEQTSTYEFHNKELHDIQLVVLHNYAKSYQAETELTATLWGENGVTTLAPSDSQSHYIREVTYRLKLREDEVCRLVILERIRKKEELAMFNDFSSKLIFKLKRKRIISEDVATEMTQILKIKEAIGRLKWEKAMHEKKIRSVRTFLLRRAGIKEYYGEKADDETYFSAVPKLTAQIEKIAEIIFEMGCKEMELREEVKEKELDIMSKELI